MSGPKGETRFDVAPHGIGTGTALYEVLLYLLLRVAMQYGDQSQLPSDAFFDARQCDIIGRKFNLCQSSPQCSPAALKTARLTTDLASGTLSGGVTFSSALAGAHGRPPVQTPL